MFFSHRISSYAQYAFEDGVVLLDIEVPDYIELFFKFTMGPAIYGPIQ